MQHILAAILLKGYLFLEHLTGTSNAKSGKHSGMLAFNPISAKICHLKHSGILTVYILRVYASTVTATSDVKDSFYKQLQSVFHKLTRCQITLLMDVDDGSDRRGWGQIHGKFRLGVTNDNGHC